MAVPLSRAEGMKVRMANDPPPAVAKTAKELKVEQKAAKKTAKIAKKEQKKKSKKPVGSNKANREPPKRFTTKNVINLPKEIRTANPEVKLGQRKESKSKTPLRILGM